MTKLSDFLNALVKSNVPDGAPKIKRCIHILINEDGTCGYLANAGDEEENLAAVLTVAQILASENIQLVLDDTQETLSGGFKQNSSGRPS
jgi:hypothetical protein